MDDWQPVSVNDWQPVAAKSKAYTSDILPFSKDEQGNIHLAIPNILKPAEQGGQSLYDTKPQTTISDSDVGPLTAGTALKGAALLAPMAPGPAGAVFGVPTGIRSAPIVPKIAPQAVKEAATSVYENPAVRATPIPARAVADIGESAANTFIKDHPQVNDIAGELRNIAPQKYIDETGVPVDTLDNISQRLGRMSKETQMGRAGPEPTPKAAAASQLKSQIDDLVSSHVPEWNTADQNYGAFKKADAFDKRSNIAQIRAEGGTGDYAARLKSAATQILVNPRAMRGMTADQIAQLKTIQHGTATQNTLNWFGTVLGSNRMKYGVGGMLGAGLGFSGGGPAGATMGYLAGAATDTGLAKAAMGLRNRGATKRATALSQSLLAGSPYGRSLERPNPSIDPRKAAIVRALLQSPQLRAISSNFIPSYAGNQQP